MIRIRGQGNGSNEGHNKCFYENKNKENYPKLSLLPLLIWSAGLNSKDCD